MTPITLTMQLEEADRTHTQSLTISLDDGQVASVVGELAGLKTAYEDAAAKVKHGAPTATMTVSASANGAQVDAGGPWKLDNAGLHATHEAFANFQKRMIDLRLKP